jgi:hypothetical protein
MRNNIQVGRGKSCGKIYYLPAASKNTDIAMKADSTTAVWHQRFGHADINNVIKMSTIGSNIGLPKLKSIVNNPRCEDCVIGKTPRLPFKPDNRRVDNILDLVYMDLCSPMKNKSLGRNSYLYSLTDAKSRMRFVYFLKSKDQDIVLMQFKQFQAYSENQTGPKQ